MHISGWKQQMGSLNKFSAFPMVQYRSTPAHPPLLQTNPPAGSPTALLAALLQQHCALPTDTHNLSLAKGNLAQARPSAAQLPRSTQVGQEGPKVLSTKLDCNS